MTIDYAKKTPQPPQRSRRLWVIALVILALVLAIPAIFYVHYMHMPHFHNKNIITKPITKPQKMTQHNAVEQNQFDFYSMLPKMQVAVKEGSPAAIQIPANQPYYLLQVATSSNEQAANKLITKLGVMGLNAFSKTLKLSNGKTQYQILAGPYLTNKSAATDQAYLKTNHIDSIKLKTTNYLK